MTQNGHKIIIPGGYYLKARKIQNSAIQKQPPHVREIWDWLLKEANHKDKEYNGFMIKRGQLFRTYDEIREGLHWMIGYRKMMYTKDHTKKAMKFLRKHQMIATKKALGGVLITILNYNYYQNPKNYESTNESHIESTNEAPMKHHESPHYNKNDKNEKNNNKERESLLSLFEKIEDKFNSDELKYKSDFIEYWTEKKHNGKKERWEMEKVYDVNRRFRTWLQNADKWAKYNYNDKTKSKSTMMTREESYIDKPDISDED